MSSKRPRMGHTARELSELRDDLRQVQARQRRLVRVTARTAGRRFDDLAKRLDKIDGRLNKLVTLIEHTFGVRLDDLDQAA